MPLFADLERDALVALVGCMAYREVPAGELISAEGQGGDTIFVIVAGKAEVTRQVDGAAKTLARAASRSEDRARRRGCRRSRSRRGCRRARAPP